MTSKLFLSKPIQIYFNTLPDIDISKLILKRKKMEYFLIMHNLKLKLNQFG